MRRVHSQGAYGSARCQAGVCRHEFVKSAALCRDSCDAGAPECSVVQLLAPVVVTNVCVTRSSLLTQQTHRPRSQGTQVLPVSQSQPQARMRQLSSIALCTRHHGSATLVRVPCTWDRHSAEFVPQASALIGNSTHRCGEHYMLHS
jgi:hypothetical protein